MRWEACFDCGRFDSRVCASLALAPAVRDAVTCLLCMYNTAEGVRARHEGCNLVHACGLTQVGQS